MKAKDVFKTPQSNCGYYRANELVWSNDYSTEKLDWLWSHGMLCESKKRYPGDSTVLKYYAFTNKGRWLQNWYKNTFGDFLYYYILHLYQVKIWWQRLMIKFGKHYAWQEYEDIDLNEI
jgi:hypothetical protein